MLLYPTQLLLLSLLASVSSAADPTSPIWPRPAKFSCGTGEPAVVAVPAPPGTLFAATGELSDVLTLGMARFTDLLRLTPEGQDDSSADTPGERKSVQRSPKSYTKMRAKSCTESPAPVTVTRCTVKVVTDDLELQMGTDESYSLSVTSEGLCSIESQTAFGALHAMETVFQLAAPDWSGTRRLGPLPLQVADAPRFPHRGLLIDTSRHFLPLGTIKAQIDAMAAARLNVLHWHAVDDQSFPLEVEGYPSLAAMGAFDPQRAVYTSDQVRDVVGYARERGVRVMIEMDMPGHMGSWVHGEPRLTGRASCGIDPTLNETYAILAGVLNGVTAQFPESLIHLGGDEVDIGCWSTYLIEAFFISIGVTHGDAQAYFESRLCSAEVLGALNRTDLRPVFWQEAFQSSRGADGLGVRADAIIELWETANATALLREVLDAGHDALSAGPYYLSEVGTTWDQFYVRDPLQGTGTGTRTTTDSRVFPGASGTVGKVIGGEACLWGERVDAHNAIARSWPRAAAVAEQLWSPAEAPKVPAEAAGRLHRWVCLARLRGIGAEPVGVNWGGLSWCDFDKL